jgi:imidazole glycerol-phosphate synthase subunit HisF
MLRTRIIPTLLLRNESLVKTIRFGKFTYVGDPCNTARIFNELEVDELAFLDITATREGRTPNLKVLADIANECFMPLSYGGGVRSLDQAKAIFEIGFEKIVVNSASITNPELITQIAQVYGSQAVIASIDVKNTIWGQQRVRGESGRCKTNLEPVTWAMELESLGAGEILLTSMDREATWVGFDLELVKRVSDSVTIPVIAHGGAGSVDDIRKVVEIGHASAVAVGSMVVFQKKGMGVLVSYPDKELLSWTIL